MERVLRYKLLCILCLGFYSFLPTYSQTLRGTTGLLHAPSAEMQPDKTFMFGANVLDIVPLHYYHFGHEVTHTYSYYLNMTFFPWLEVGYTCTLNYAEHGSQYFPEYVWGKYTNQDRAFNVRLRLWKEGWWKSWSPQIVLGADDVTSHVSYGGGDIEFGSGMNNYFTRFYLAATKHFEILNYGILGVHSAFVMGRGVWDVHYDRPSFGLNYKFQIHNGNSFFSKILNGFNVMAEYDARTVNVGGEYSLPIARMKNGNEAFSVHVLGELNDGKYFSGGVQCKVHLK